MVACPHGRQDGEPRAGGSHHQARRLPPWIRREEVYDIADPERWTKLVRVLQGPGKIKRAPYMTGDLPDNFVPREVEYTALKAAVLAQGQPSVLE